MLTPEEIVKKLDKYIVGQNKAKKIISIALRNRWRRIKLKKNIRKNITPKNILLIGPTGIGKTEISKKISEILDFPFIKVEATKFTEVGYVGKDADSIIKDLADISFKFIKNKIIKKNKKKAEKNVEEKIINILLNNINKDNINNNNIDKIKNKIKLDLKKGILDNKEIEIKLNDNIKTQFGVEIISNNNNEDLNNQLKSIFKNISLNNKNKIYKITIKEAKKILLNNEINNLINIDKIKIDSIKLIEETGIVYIDEIDKICKNNNYSSNNCDISNEGVQRDFLSLTDGCMVNTKYGFIKTNYILFIASGSFYNSSPSDLIPEFQGRFPIKIYMDKLNEEDYKNILENFLINKYKLLLLVDKINITFSEYSINYISKFCYKENIEKENIGARRLNVILEKILENISFNVLKYKNKNIIIDKKYLENINIEDIKLYDINKYII